jgi:hypothetical protein
VPEPYCHSCYRTLPDDRTACFSCDVTRHQERGRPSGIAVAAGVPFLIVGILAHNTRLCYVAAVVSAVAIVVSIVRTLRAPSA